MDVLQFEKDRALCNTPSIKTIQILDQGTKKENFQNPENEDIFRTNHEITK